MKKLILLFIILSSVLIFSTGCAMMNLSGSLLLNQVINGTNTHHAPSKVSHEELYDEDDLIDKDYELDDLLEDDNKDLKQQKQEIKPADAELYLTGNWQGTINILGEEYTLNLKMNSDDKCEAVLSSENSMLTQNTLSLKGTYKVKSNSIKFKFKDLDSELKNLISSDKMRIEFDYALTENNSVLTLTKNTHSVSFIKDDIILKKS